MAPAASFPTIAIYICTHDNTFFLSTPQHKGFGNPVSAIDVVHAITALMETGDSDTDVGRKGSEEKDDDGKRRLVVFHCWSNA